MNPDPQHGENSKGKPCRPAHIQCCVVPKIMSMASPCKSTEGRRDCTIAGEQLNKL